MTASQKKFCLCITRVNEAPKGPGMRVPRRLGHGSVLAKYLGCSNKMKIVIKSGAGQWRRKVVIWRENEWFSYNPYRLNSIYRINNSNTEYNIFYFNDLTSTQAIPWPLLHIFIYMSKLSKENILRTFYTSNKYFSCIGLSGSVLMCNWGKSIPSFVWCGHKGLDPSW